ncbi:ATP-binding protein [Persicirhabdus sediminis]|uniref:ATP-binding protein n=1 Tax=Persicirhabdus sediminis TaxID=454144 RepID=A0A8J7MFV8_9BACT|nr:DUF87 domain-containing protein [Persicirhabdus sediminis]MBK1792726.1 ATP-binding protein [Persicirhabdus sediminis]
MPLTIDDYEGLGSFYLGREYDPASKKLADDPLLYDSKDLVTHGVVLGMTGSGKTGLCLSLLEEAGMDHIPAIVIDPKGDIANLMLTFPELQADDFTPWIDPNEASKKGLQPAEAAEKTAQLWKNGLADWGQNGERIQQFKNKVDVNVFTPGSKAGIPVSILGSLQAPAAEILDDSELLGDCIESTVASLLTLIGHKGDSIQSPEAILLANIFQHCWLKQQDLTLETLIQQVMQPSFHKIGVIDLDSFINQKARNGLAMKLNGLLASPSFKNWLSGPALDIDEMLYHRDGRARISIFSIAHLSDTERMFFVSLLLNQMLAWMRRQAGTGSLRALLYMDEIYGYLPPTANPASKKPLMTILKQGRAFGLGALLATQNPVDLDYKALSNIGTWWLGRLQTDQDKQRVIDGLMSASQEQANPLDRKQIEETLSGLKSRVFMMNNVHDDGPVYFHVRWVMSYLRGPLTRTQIKSLMDPKRDEFTQLEPSQPAVISTGMSMAAAKAASANENTRPTLASSIKEFFVPAQLANSRISYSPALLREAECTFSSKKYQLDKLVKIRKVNEMLATGIDWEDEIKLNIPSQQLEDSPVADASFSPLPAYAVQPANYKSSTSEFADWIYQNERAKLLTCPSLDEHSQIAESEATFRARLKQEARESRDLAVAKVELAVSKKVHSKKSQLKTAQRYLKKQESEASSAKIQAGVSILGKIVGALFGKRKIGLSTVSSSTSSATRAYKQHSDVKQAEEKIESIEDDILAIEAELQQEIEKLDQQFDPQTIELTEVEIKPYKKNIKIKNVAIIWLPLDMDGNPAW